MSTMTQTEHPRRTADSGQSDRPAPRARLISGRLALALLSSFGALTSFYLLLSVTPMYAMSAGAGSAEAGVVTGALPPDRRGEGIGLAGVVACLPAIVALPSGVWLAENTGYAVVIAVTAVSALAPLAAIPWLGGP